MLKNEEGLNSNQNENKPGRPTIMSTLDLVMLV